MKLFSGLTGGTIDRSSHDDEPEMCAANERRLPARQICERARLSRDHRFDGLFYTAVKTTGIFCRPVCPAPAAKASNVAYYSTAAAASAAGYRPCLRCRPEQAPGAPVHRLSQMLVRQALQKIERGALDTGTVGQLAKRLGVGERHLRRLFQQSLGVSPQQVALSRRLLFAKRLLHDTALSVTEVALAAGFGSSRRFNDAFRRAYHLTPSQLRRRASAAEVNQQHLDAGPPAAPGMVVRLPYRPPYHFAALLNFFRQRAIEGLEQVSETAYRRIVGDGHEAVRIHVYQQVQEHCLLLELYGAQPHQLMSIISGVRRLFDVDADSMTIDRYLIQQADLTARVRARPGLRVPGSMDGFEIAVRAIVGQQVSLRAARTLLRRVIIRCGGVLADEGAFDDGLRLCFPTPAKLAAADLQHCGLTRRRVETLQRMARAVLEGEVSLEAGQSLAQFVEAWCRLPGIGPWTAHYLAMRALHEPDAFPAGDLVLRRALGQPLSERELECRSEAWRPWRAYAALQLWQD